jgi:4-hydroxy-tetrahydrodipicolinate reductase
MTRIVMAGASGRMGRSIIRTLADTSGAQLVAAVERHGHADLGKDSGELAGIGKNGILVTHDAAAALAKADVWIDFTAPEAAAHAAEVAAQHKVALVIGTTGLADAHRAAIERAAQHVPAVVSSNMSVGVNVLVKLLALAARALGSGFDPEIVELHHRGKKDAPSGTALMMAGALTQAMGRSLKTDAVYGRQGQIGARGEHEVGILAVRGGDVVGDHTVYFLGQGERIELAHRATSRDTFARGAVRAAMWASGRAAGIYDMQDVLGMK